MLLLSDYGTVIALDRAGGRELWRRVESVETQPLAASSPELQAHDAVKREGDSKATRRVETLWALSAGGVVDPDGPVAFLMEYQRITVPDSTRANGERITETHAETALQGVTGQTLWSAPLTDLNRVTKLVGNLLIDYTPGEAQPHQETAIHYRNAATGTALEAESRQGRAAIQAASARQDASALLSATYNALYALDLEAGTATCLYRARGYLQSATLYAKADRIVLYNNADDDFAGHSVWPHYVDCMDRKGNKIWSFPRVLHFIGAEEMKTIPEPYSIVPMVPCRAADSVLCVSDRVAPDGKQYGYGLDVRNGHLLWKRALPAGSPVCVEAGRGFLLATSHGPASAGRTGLAWMEGRTGKLSWIAQTPPVANLFLTHEDLLLLDTQGNLRCYTRNGILPATAQ